MIRYTAEFKNKVCKEYHSAIDCKSELQRKYGIKGHDRLKQWLEKFPFFDEPPITPLPLSTPSTKGQIKMAVKSYSDISGLLTTFISVDSYAGETPATSFGRNR